MRTKETVRALSTPLTALSVAADAPRNRARLILVARTALVIGACLGGYHYSLLTLLRGLTMPAPLACLGVVPLISLVLCSARAAQAGDEPDIHDRYLDWIVGLPLLATALAMVWIVPIRLSTYFWLSRLDLLSLPLFVAGAVGLVFGTRALWRMRIAIAFLALAWPIPYLQLASSGLEIPGVFAGATHTAARHLAAILPVALRLDPAFMGAGAVLGFLFIGLVVGPAGRQASPGTGPRPARTGLAVPRARIALGVLLVAGALAGTANESLRWFDQVATPLAQPRLQPSAVANHPVPGWIVLKSDSYTWVTGYLGRNGGWDRYLYASGTGQPAAARPGSLSAITLDLFTTTDRGALTACRTELPYHLHGFRLVETRPADLGGGVIGQSIIYRSHRSSETWTAVYWDWPVKTEGGPGYERVVLNVKGPVHLAPRVASGPNGVLDRLRAGVEDVLGRSSGSSATASEEALRRFLIGFARRVVLASVGRPA